MKNRRMMFISQFFDFEVIRQAALSHEEGYEHHFYPFIKMVEVTFEALPQSYVTLVSLFLEEYREKIPREDRWLVLSSSFTFMVNLHGRNNSSRGINDFMVFQLFGNISHLIADLQPKNFQ